MRHEFYRDTSDSSALGIIEIKKLLREENIIFIIDDCGMQIKIPSAETFDFWKRDVIPRVVEPDKAKSGFRLEDYADEYCYIAYYLGKEQDERNSCILLRMFH